MVWSAAVVVLLPGTAQSGVIQLGNSGWRAVWDISLDPYVSISVDSVTSEAVYIEKSAQFTQPPGPGGFPTIPIQFQQISYSAVPQIIILDESITKSDKPC